MGLYPAENKGSSKYTGSDQRPAELTDASYKGLHDGQPGERT